MFKFNYKIRGFMELKIIEKTKKKIKVEVRGETHTFLNLLSSKAWEAKAKQSSYIIEHPYLSEPKIVVYGDNPQKILLNASQLMIDELKEFSKHFNNTVKK